MTTINHPTPRPKLTLQQVLLRISPLITLILFVLSAVQFSATSRDWYNAGQGTFLMALGGLSVGVWLWLSGQPQWERGWLALSIPTQLLYIGLLIVGASMLAAVTLSGIRSPINPTFRNLSYELQAVLFYGGLLFVMFGLGGAGMGAWLRARIAFFRTQTGIALLLILALAFGLRVIGTDIPMSVDDSPHIPAIWGFLLPTPSVGLIEPNSWQTSHLFAYLQGISLRTFGLGLAPARLPAGIIGSLGVIGMFLLVDAFFGDRRLAILSALILATFPPHIHFSRQIMLHIADMTFGLFAFAFLGRGLRYRQRYDWVLAGIFWGLTQYFFEAGRLFYPVLLLMWVAAMVFFALIRWITARLTKKSVELAVRPILVGALFTCIAAIFTITPIYTVILRNSNTFSVRLNDTGDTAFWQNLVQNNFPPDQLRIAADKIRLPILLYVSIPENMYYYRGTQPIIPYVIVPFFLIGFGVLVVNGIGTKYILFPLWILGTVAANAIMRDPMQVPRHIVSFPALVVAIIIGANFLIGVVINAQRAPKLSRAMVAVTSLAIALFGGVFYFTNQLPSLRNQQLVNSPTPDPLDVVMRATGFPEGTQVYYVSDPLAPIDTARDYMSLHRFYAKRAVQLDVLTPAMMNAEFFQKALTIDRDLAFFVSPIHLKEIPQLLSQHFKVEAPQKTTRTDIPEAKAYVLYYVKWYEQPKVSTP
jgi:hypothetical protein